jgi:diguanylate cyclase (GGDEF)-like protein
MYGSAYWLLLKRFNTPALLLIWLEVLGHAAIGSMLVGWDSGFHYYLLMFIPAIVVSGSRRATFPLLLLLFVFYMGLHVVSHASGMRVPLSGVGLWTLRSFNVATVFAMAAYTARFYYLTVRRAERKLVELATTDPLTGLSNRRNLLAEAGQVIARARRLGQPTALVIADIDHFKQVNDQYGHEAGDHVLAQVGTLFAAQCREQDMVARWGGEEFLFLLPATDLEAAQTLAERMRAAVAATTMRYGDTVIACTVSLGVAQLAADEPLNEAIARADRGLYQSKAQGRNRVSAAG